MKARLCIGLTIFGAMSCGASSTIELTETTNFKLSVGAMLQIGIDLAIRLPATTPERTARHVRYRRWDLKPFDVLVTTDPEQIRSSSDQPCASPSLRKGGSTRILSEKQLEHGPLWVCEIRDEHGALDGVWISRLVHNVSDVIECHIALGASPTDAKRSAAVAICESLHVVGRSEFTQKDAQGSTDTVQQDRK